MDDKNKNRDQFLYNIAWETRNFEIRLFWQRSNYFLVLNTAIAIGFFKLMTDQPSYSWLLAVIGFFVSCLWFCVNLGSKFWQCRWEERLRITEEKLEDNIDFFAANRDVIKKDVEKSLERAKHGKLREKIDRLVLTKPSVSLMMKLLSMLFILIWFIAIIISVVLVVTSKIVPENVAGNIVEKGRAITLGTTGTSTSQWLSSLMQIIPVIAVVIAAILGYHKYLRQREHEQITKRYLENGVDSLMANIEHGLGVFKKNYIHALSSLKLFKETQTLEIPLDPKTYSKEFKEYCPEAFYTAPLYRLQRLIGKENVEVFNEAIQEFFSFLDKTTMFFEGDLCTAIKVSVGGNKKIATAQEIFDCYVVKTKELSDESMKYYTIISALQGITWILETSAFSFKKMKGFKDKPEIKDCVEKLKQAFADSQDSDEKATKLDPSTSSG